MRRCCPAAGTFRRIAVVGAISGSVVLGWASASGAATTVSSLVAVTTTTLAAPHLVQSSLTFSQNSHEFSDTVLVGTPANPAPEFFLRLAPSSPAIDCKATAEPNPPQYDGVVNGFNVVCNAGQLPSLYAPTLEVIAAKSASAFIPVTLINNTGGAVQEWLPFAVGGMLAVIVLLFSFFLLGKQRRPGMMAKVNADVAWSPSDSWLTNVTAIGALLTAAASAGSGTLATVLPGLPSARIEVLSLTFAALLALAPLLYALLSGVSGTSPPTALPGKLQGASSEPPMPAVASAVPAAGPHSATPSTTGSDTSAGAAPDQRNTHGNVIGVLLQCAVTLIAVFGELTTLFLIVRLSTANGGARFALQAAPVVGGVFVLLYAIISTKRLIDPDAQGGKASSFMTHTGTVASQL